jgi:enoyl-CoA hydratase/carnithine racemase
MHAGVLYAMLTLPGTGETAGDLGLASFVVPEEEVESRALDLVQELASGPTPGCAAVRQILRCDHQAASQEPMR